jgi:hypothetical protein
VCGSIVSCYGVNVVACDLFIRTMLYHSILNNSSDPPPNLKITHKKSTITVANNAALVRSD